MRSTDLDFAASCTAAEGWASETLPEFEGFFAHDPGGCFVAETDGRRVGICVATSYGEAGFVGELIVLPPSRNQGIGRRLLDHAIDYLRSRGARAILLDGVPAAVPLYERAGFRKVCRSLRFAGVVSGRVDPRVRPMGAADLGTVAAMDRRAFGADRGDFLRRRWALYPEFARVAEEGGRITGFILGRRAPEACAAGPWIAALGAGEPQGLLESLAPDGARLAVRLGVLEANTRAVAAIRGLGFRESEEPPWRMLLGEPAGLGTSDQCCAIGSAAKG